MTHLVHYWSFHVNWKIKLVEFLCLYYTVPEAILDIPEIFKSLEMKSLFLSHYYSGEILKIKCLYELEIKMFLYT